MEMLSLVRIETGLEAYQTVLVSHFFAYRYNDKKKYIFKCTQNFRTDACFLCNKQLAVVYLDDTAVEPCFFSVLDCGEPPPLENASIRSQNGTVFGSNVTYECSDKSVKQRTCLASGNWSNVGSTCGE